MPGRLVHIPAWWVIVGVMTCVITPVLSIIVSTRIADNNREQAANEAARVAAEARVEATERYCRLFATQVDVYQDAQTPVGKQAYRIWLDEYRAMGCKPPR